MEKLLISNSSVSRNYNLVQFDPHIGPYQVLPLRVRVMAMKEYSAFSKALDLWKPHHQIV